MVENQDFKARLIQRAEEALKTAEKNEHQDSPVIADRLEGLSKLLRESNLRPSDVSEMELRAKDIRTRIAEENARVRATEMANRNVLGEVGFRLIEKRKKDLDECEKSLGTNSIVYAKRLEELALAIEKSNTRLDEAADLRVQARNIRDRLSTENVSSKDSDTQTSASMKDMNSRLRTANSDDTEVRGIKGINAQENSYQNPVAKSLEPTRKTQPLLVGVIVIIVLMLTTTFLVGSLVHEDSQPISNGEVSQSTQQSLEAQEPEVSPPEQRLTVGSELEVKATGDNCLLFFLDVRAIKEYSDAVEANDQEGIDALHSRMDYICEPTSMRVLKSEIPNTAVVKVRLLSGLGMNYEAGDSGWVISSQLNQFISN